MQECLGAKKPQGRKINPNKVLDQHREVEEGKSATEEGLPLTPQGARNRHDVPEPYLRWPELPASVKSWELARALDVDPFGEDPPDLLQNSM